MEPIRLRSTDLQRESSSLERAFEQIAAAAPCGMVIVNVERTIVRVNPQAEAMFGYSRTELIGNPMQMLVPEHFRAALGEHELIARRKDGSEFTAAIGLNLMPGEEDGLVLASVTDITRRKQMLLAMRRAISNLEEFTYAAAHDLKSPLRGIAALVEWIAEDLGDAQPPEAARNLGRVRDRVQRLDRVIDDLLAYAHAGIAAADAAPVDAAALIENVLELLPSPPGFRISVQIDAAPFVTNKAPLESVLRNLVDNAIKHHDRPIGHIALQVRTVDRYCVFSVTDDGPGIASERHSGIGLALAKRMVEAHGGWLKLESAAGVRGTAFHVGWPRSQGQATDD